MVEDVLVHDKKIENANKSFSLNPCCGGRCSSTFCATHDIDEYDCLNPCCGGRCSSTIVYCF